MHYARPRAYPDRTLDSHPEHMADTLNRILILSDLA